MLEKKLPENQVEKNELKPRIFGKKMITLALCAILSGIFDGCTLGHGDDAEYYSSGQYKCEYVDGKYVHYDYVVEGNQLIRRVSIEGEGLENGVRDGKRIWYCSDGNIHHIGNYKNGKKDGERVWYRYNGNIMCICNYKKGKENGECKRFYQDGQIQEEGTYKNGKKDGDWTLYYENGQKIEKQKFKKGKQEFDGIILNEDGSVKSEFFHKDGKKYGIINGNLIEFE